MNVLNKPLIIVILINLLASCTAIDHSQKRRAFISIDSTPVFANEFIYVFNKNNFNESQPTEKDIDEYLDLFINFKLKVAEAKALGYHNTSGFIQEFQTYREELAKPYLTENIVTDQLVRQAYERMKEEVKASHILILVDEKSSPEDTLKAYSRINELRQRIVKGEDFHKVASEHSQDPSAKTNGGDLGYFTALQMVYPFEEQAFNTPPGEISPVFKTRFGYHILKVHDRRQSMGKIKVSHIMIRATDGISAEDSLNASKKVHEIYNGLQKGDLWFDLCQQFSEDLSTKANGGILPWFGSGNMIPQFEEAAFALKDIGEVSKPIKTSYGWHIIKLEERKGLEPFEEIQENIKNLVKRDTRSELSKKAFIERLKKENNFIEQGNVIASIKSNPEQYLKEENGQSKSIGDQEVFRINQTTYLISDLTEYLKDKVVNVDKNTLPGIVSVLYNAFVEEKLVEYEKEQLANKYYDYKMLLTEYEEGILLFQLMDDRIWSAALEDTAGLNTFFQEHLHNYQWEQRLDAVIYNASNESIRNKIKPLIDKEYLPVPSATRIIDFDGYEISLSTTAQDNLKNIAAMLKKNKSWVVRLNYKPTVINQQRIDSMVIFLKVNMVPNEQILLAEDIRTAENKIETDFVTFSRKSLENTFNNESGLDLKIEEGSFEKGDHHLIDLTTWKEGLYDLNANGRFYLIEVRKVVPPEPKRLEDIRGMVISDYQNYLEKEWIKELKEKYPVTINNNERKKIYKKLTAI